jgi:deoxycytidine triphosphate deaminase
MAYFPAIVYENIKIGHMSFEEFDKWLIDNYDAEYQRGYNKGFDEAKELYTVIKLGG